jgi:LmbE family N-acetylglucosaminyl deacetylase
MAPLRRIASLDDFRDPILVVTAHPDDIEVHCGGTLAELVTAGKEVTCVLCTRGNRGTSNPAVAAEQLGALRQREQLEASATLGVRDVRFLDYDDDDLQFCVPSLREAMVRLIRAVRPKTVITHDPYPGDGGNDSCSIYPDHLTVGRVVFEAAYVCAPGPLFYPEHLREGLAPHKPAVLQLIMSQHADLFMPIASVWDVKLKAIRQHRSQGRDTSDNDRVMERIARQNGARVGVPMAEAFRVLLPT